jgi:hypothetical protein
MKRSVVLFLSIAAIAGAVGVGLFVATASIAGDQWKPIDTAPPQLFKQLQQDIRSSSSETPQLGKTQFLRVNQPQQTAPIFLVDTSPTFRDSYKTRPALCGNDRCSFFVYLQKNGYRQVSSGLVRPYTSDPQLAIVEVTNRIVNGLPCLRFNQSRQAGATECFDGDSYQRAN